MWIARNPVSMRISVLHVFIGSLVGVLGFGGSLLAQVPNRYITAQTDLPCVDQTLSLRVHVNYDFDGPQAFDTVAFRQLVGVTNDAFAPICLRFEVCEFLEVENYRYSSYERRDSLEQVALYADPNRIDVFITVRDSSASGRCGFATQNGIRQNSRAFVELLNVAPCTDSTSYALAHELGHYLGLYNTYETQFGAGLVNGEDCATTGDLICDTPADPFDEQSGATYVANDDPCRITFGGQDANGQFYVPHTGNIMGQYDMSCRCDFTHDQLLKMATNFSEYRDGIY